MPWPSVHPDGPMRPSRSRIGGLLGTDPFFEPPVCRLSTQIAPLLAGRKDLHKDAESWGDKNYAGLLGRLSSESVRAGSGVGGRRPLYQSQFWHILRFRSDFANLSEVCFARLAMRHNVNIMSIIPPSGCHVTVEWPLSGVQAPRLVARADGGWDLTSN